MAEEEKDPESRLAIETSQRKEIKTLCLGLNAPSLCVVFFIIFCGVYGVSVAFSGEIALGIGSSTIERTKEPTHEPTFIPSNSPTQSPTSSPSIPPTTTAEGVCATRPGIAADVMKCIPAFEEAVFCFDDGTIIHLECDIGACQCDADTFVLVSNLADPCFNSDCIGAVPL
eukprot:snap_masked-scaffold_75-processed-gene-0.31-mRNA-1 protein AED:1.00 eAED:1.00 QI:0/-1/0/0/-1/1/1/0/170